MNVTLQFASNPALVIAAPLRLHYTLQAYPRQTRAVRQHLPAVVLRWLGLQER